MSDVKLREHVATINVPTKVGRRSWRQCWLIVAGAASLFGINETLTRRAKAVYSLLARRHGYGIYGLWTSPNPVFYDRKVWRPIKAVSGAVTRVVKLHDAGPWEHQYPGYNGARYVTIRLLEHKRTGLLHAAVWTHLVPNGHKVEPHWRTKVRTSSIDQLRTIVSDLADAGAIVILGGDLNIAEHVDLGPDFTWVRPLGIDKLGIETPDGVEVVHQGVEVMPLPARLTDHEHYILATLDLRGTSEYSSDHGAAA